MFEAGSSLAAFEGHGEVGTLQNVLMTRSRHLVSNVRESCRRGRYCGTWKGGDGGDWRRFGRRMLAWALGKGNRQSSKDGPMARRLRS